MTQGLFPSPLVCLCAHIREHCVLRVVQTFLSARY